LLDARAHRAPRAANDNASSLSRQLYRFFPLVAAFLAFAWALWQVFASR
jgi:hypothetical protein